MQYKMQCDVATGSRLFWRCACVLWALVSAFFVFATVVASLAVHPHTVRLEPALCTTCLRPNANKQESSPQVLLHTLHLWH